jgi:hypothetical protein
MDLLDVGLGLAQQLQHVEGEGVLGLALLLIRLLN